MLGVKRGLFSNEAGLGSCTAFLILVTPLYKPDGYTLGWLGEAFITVALVLTVWGVSQDLATVFVFADLSMGLLALVNLVALVMLMPVGLRILADYERQRLAVLSPSFVAADHDHLGIDPRSWPSG